MRDAYLSIDHNEDLIISMAMTAESAALVERSAHYWKWVVISTHSALQAAFVLCLTVGDSLKVGSKWSTKDHIAARNRGENYVAEKMLNFCKLYETVKNTDLNGYQLTPTPTQEDGIERLNSMRGSFVHFLYHQIIEKSLLPRMCLNSIAVIAELEENFLYGRWFDEAQRNQFHKNLATSKANLEKLDATYSS